MRITTTPNYSQVSSNHGLIQALVPAVTLVGNFYNQSIDGKPRRSGQPSKAGPQNRQQMRHRNCCRFGLTAHRVAP